MMNTIQDKLGLIRTLVREVADCLADDSLEDSVEVGTALASVVRISNEALTSIKGTFRTAALGQNKGRPGTRTFDGLQGRQVSVAVPTPTLRLLKSVDMDRIRRVLGDDFEKFFETKVSYKPRSGLQDRIMSLPAGDIKNTLLLALEEVEGTPRVSFPKR
jgi:hypothetical protein